MRHSKAVAVLAGSALLLFVLAPVSAAASSPTAPGPPTAVVASPGDGGATVAWKAPPSDGGDPITGYTITADPGAESVSVQDVTSYTVGDLKNGTAYSFTVAATNAVGTGKPSSPSAAVTPRAPTVPSAPRSVSAVAGYEEATVSWAAPKSSGGAPVTSYTVKASPGDEHLSVQGDGTSATVTGLTDGTSYILSVSAINSLGKGPAKKVKAVVPGPTVPDPPASIQVTPRTDGTLSVTWVAPVDNGGAALSGYTVTAQPGDEVQDAGPTATSATLSGLDDATAYTVSVTASNANGTSLGAASKPVTPAVTVSDATVVLSASSLAALSEVKTNGTLVFTSPPSQVTSLKKGDIVVAGVSTATPAGLLDQVTKVTTSGSTTDVATIEASLDEALSAGSFGMAGALTSSAGERPSFTPARPGVKMAPQSPSSTITLVSFDTDLYRDDNGNAVTASGSVTLTPKVNLSGSISCCFSINTAFTASVTAEAQLHLSANLSYELDESYKLGTICFPAITFFVGPVPVVIKPILELYLDADGSVSVGMEAGVEESATLGMKIATEGSEVSASPIHSFTTSYQPPAVTGAFEIKGGVEGKLAFLLYGVAGPYLTDTIWLLDLKADTSKNPWWTLNIDNQVGGGFELTVLGQTLEDWDDPSLLEFSHTLAKADGPFDGVKITPNPAEVSPGKTVQLSASRVGALGGTTTWSVPTGDGTINSNGLYTAPSTPGTYQVTASVPASGIAPASTGVDDVYVGVQPPGTPTDVIADSVSPGEASVSWQDSSTDVTGYSITSSPSSGTHSSSGVATTLTIDGLKDGETYTFVVTAADKSGDSLASGPSNAVTIADAPPLPNAWAWGDGSDGELGDGYSESNPEADSCDGNSTTTGDYCSSVPVGVSGLSDVIAIAGGFDDGYALRSDGTVWSWGDGSYGELGNGYSESNPEADSCDGESGYYCSSVPVQVSGLSDVVAIAGGWEDGYALRSDGTVWSWGDGEYGGLGNDYSSANKPADSCDYDSTTSYPYCSSVPVEVSGLSDVVAIAGGGFADGGEGYALRSDGTVWSWGYGGDGELGNGYSNANPVADSCDGNSSYYCSSVPVEVSGLSDVVAIAGGYEDGYALRSDGTVWSWGIGGYGELGDGYSSANQPADSCNYESTSGGYYCSSVPVEVSGLSDVVAIAGGAYNGYALRSDGTVWSWGVGEYGGLGNGYSTANQPADSCDAESTSGYPYCSSVPVQVSGLSDVVAIAGGFEDGYALRSDGTVWSWGNGVAGELGNGYSGANPMADSCDGNSTTSSNYCSSVPVRVSGLSGVRSIGPGYAVTSP